MSADLWQKLICCKCCAVLLHETHEAFEFGGTAGAAPARRELGQTAAWRNGAAGSGEMTEGQQQRQQSQQGRGTSRQRQGAQGQPKRAALNVQTRGGSGGGRLSEHGTGHGAARGGAAHDSGSRLAAAALRAAMVVAGVMAGSLARSRAPQCAACMATPIQRTWHCCRQTQMLAFWSTSRRAQGGWHTHISRHAGGHRASTKYC